MVDEKRGPKVARINGGDGLWLPPGTQKAKPKEPGRNDPCPCGSDKKYKKCCGAALLSEERPPCSVPECAEQVEFFLGLTVDGFLSTEHFWVSCKDHVEDISVGAAQHGIDVTVIPWDSLEGRVIGMGGLEVVKPEPAAEPTTEAVDETAASAPEVGETTPEAGE